MVKQTKLSPRKDCIYLYGYLQREMLAYFPIHLSSEVVVLVRQLVSANLSHDISELSTDIKYFDFFSFLTSHKRPKYLYIYHYS